MKPAVINYVCPVPESLELPDTVYKYRAVNDYLFRSLLLNQIWLAKPSSFNDPFEPERIFSDTPFSKALERNIRESGILCLCKNGFNLPMWAYYGDGLKGVAIGYDLAKLLDSLEPLTPSNTECSKRWKYVFDLAYDDAELSQIDEFALLNNDQQTDAERQKMFALKSSSFNHEEECRIVVQASPDSSPEYAWVGHGLYSHAPNAIKEIIFGELISKQDKDAVMKLIEGRDICIRDAVRDKKSFKIRIE
ncbi:MULTISPECIES: DUF2971 domain-containing protein [Deefgea]|uniref:DUF2971 domain-containing protein n=1 Tax=Deefgea chitinilytica TaxID=570276 RepID=A0ABS2CFW0_9NEIS|nr:MULTISPECIES: DUF2971 domain-containing protein [Deefgea]MBM5572271.1 DUF2971 domain-containing protein [Deefgea chitinilytica]MBM9889507.1 DUF2971 domain-containing protein [Deefgea sp. CFH1-16]